MTFPQGSDVLQWPTARRHAGLCVLLALAIASMFLQYNFHSLRNPKVCQLPVKDAGPPWTRFQFMRIRLFSLLHAFTVWYA